MCATAVTPVRDVRPSDRWLASKSVGDERPQRLVVVELLRSRERTSHKIVQHIKSVSAASAHFYWVDAIESTELDDQQPLPSP